MDENSISGQESLSQKTEKSLLVTSEEFRRNTQLLEASQSIAKVGGWELDLTTNHLYWTAETYRIHDTNPEEFNPTVDAGVGYFLPESKRQISEALELAMTKGIGYDLYLETYTTKGRKIDVRTTCEVTLVDGKPTKLTGIFQDITEQKFKEELINKGRNRFRTLVQNSPFCIHEISVEGNLLSMNPAGLQMMGVTKEEEIIGTPYLNAVCSLDRPRIEKLMQEAIHKEFRQFEFEADNGHVFKSNFVPISDETGTVTRLMGISEDITERKKAEKEIDRLQQKYLAILNAANGIVWEADAQTFQFTFVSGQAVSILGYPIHRWIDEPTFWKDHIHPEDSTWAIEYCVSCTRKNQAHDFEYRMTAADGRVVWLHDIVTVESENGKPVLLRGLMVDITERKKADELLQQSEAELKEAQSMAKLGRWEFSLETGQVKWSDSLFEISEIEKEQFEATYEAFLNTIHPEDRQRLTNTYTHSVESKQPYEIEYRLLMADGRIKHVITSGRTEYDQKGKPLRSIGITQDITEQKQREEELNKAKEKAEESEKKLLEAQALSHVGSWEYLTETDTVTWSTELLNIFERSPDLGAPRYSEQKSFYTEESFTRLDKAVLDCVEREIPYEILLNIITASGATKQIISKGQIKKDGTGKIVGCYGTAQDVTKQKELESALMAAKIKAEESDRLKSAFLANMSHEIRTPMNGIMGFANLLQKENITPQKEKEYLSMIKKSGERMLNIINDIISISKIEAGEIKVTLSPTNINEQLGFISSFFEPEATSKNIHVTVTSVLPSDKATIITDREKVYGVLTNLVKNAIKFTPAGTIELGCREKPKQAELEFFVKDMGIGISQDRLDFVFERFRQVNESTTRDYEGAGLGLAIAKAQIEMLGGKIWVESEVGKGSTFYFTIPCKRDLQTEEKQVQTKEPDSLSSKSQKNRGLKIVIAEDDFLSAIYLKAVLNINGNEILHATKGTEVVEMLRNNPSIDVVLMDISMPELSGYEATRQIRQFNKTVPVIIQSGYAFEDVMKQAREAGCTDFIAKPIDEKVLLKLVDKYVSK